MSVSKYLNGNITQPQMIASYNFMEGVIDEEEEILLSFEPNLFSIRMIALPDEVVAKPHIQFKLEPRIVVVDEIRL
jgi:hypothetical protein